jgi:UDP-3-O-[3-hydroxymyristoyl] N-acetylglucosamine deacetylase
VFKNVTHRDLGVLCFTLCQLVSAAFVCVRPAFAGEGRYFVHVPAGTNAHKFNLIDPESVDPSQLDVRAGAVDNLSDDARAQLYLQFRKDEESGQFEGSFGDYVKHKVGDPGDTFFLDVDSLGEVEDPVTRDTDEVFVPAAIENAEGRGNMATVLTSSNRSVEISSVEALLAALEQCGVDNARIEIESASVLDSSVNTVDVSSSVQVEVPIIDGSSLGFALEVQKVGLQQAQWQQHDEEGMSRVAPAPAEMLSVQDGESFVTFYPGPVPRVTAGIDEHAEASVIGRQWYSWTPCNESEVDAQDLHYRWELAAGRLTMTLPAAQKLLSEGMLRGGPDFCCLVADGDSWLDPSLERFPGEDAARSAANILLGNLSLLASPGGRGLPQGHVVAYRAGTELQLKFAKALAAHSKEWGMAEVKE